jgi:DNA-binding beta-propeller fold protein YncE
MQAMTQGRDGISLAHARALKLMRVARRLSLVAAVFVIAALLVGTAGTSYAKSKKNLMNLSTKPRLEDTIVVSNYGAVWYGSIETFGVGAGHNASPEFRIHGTNTNLGASTGAAGDAVSSVDHDIAVAIPIDFLDIDSAGCGPFGQPAAHPYYGTGLAEIFGPTSDGNSAPENIICSPNFAFGVPNTTGIFFPQGVAFESPYDNVNPAGTEILAVANQFPEVCGAPDCPCTADPKTTCNVAACAPTTPGGPTGVSLGTITEYDRSTLTPGIDNVEPFNNSPVDAINPFSLVPYSQNATIGGCYTLLAGPEDLTFDQSGYLFVVNNAGFLAPSLAAAPRYVTVYAPGASGDAGAFPISVIGLFGATAGTLLQPIAAAVDPSDNLYVTDVADNSIKIFNPFANPDPVNPFLDGELLATIAGSRTKLKAPTGIALSADGDTLYVANNEKNSLEMFTNVTERTLDACTTPPCNFNLAPTLIISGPNSKMNLPVGVALPQFTPSPL